MPTPTYDVFSKATDIVAAQEAARAAYRPRDGVRFSGATYDVPTVETVDEVAARLQADTARAQAFRRSPRGRFLTAVEAIRDAGGYASEAYDLEGIYRRSLTTLNGPGLDVAAVGAALVILNPIPGADAREARAALAELLITEAPMRAAS